MVESLFSSLIVWSQTIFCKVALTMHLSIYLCCRGMELQKLQNTAKLLQRYKTCSDLARISKILRACVFAGVCLLFHEGQAADQQRQ